MHFTFTNIENRLIIKDLHEYVLSESALYAYIVSMKFAFLISAVAASPFSEWLRSEKANTYVSTGFLPCFGLMMPLVISDGRRTISLTSGTEFESEKVTLAELPSRDDMMRIRCGDLAYAFSLMPPVSFEMSKDVIETVAAPMIELLYRAVSLRSSNYDEWIAESQLIPQYASAKGPEDVPRNWYSRLGFSPFQVTEKEAERRLGATVGSNEADNCRDMKIPGLLGSLSAVSFWGSYVYVYLENLTLELRTYRNIGSLTCRQLMDVVGQINLSEGLPGDIFELRELLRDPTKLDDRITKSGAMALTLSDGSKLTRDQHSLSVFCRPGVIAKYSSGHLDYDDKPRDFYPVRDVVGLCSIMGAKLEKFNDMLDGLVSV